MFKIGHYTDLEDITGCTVILCSDGALASCYISGSAPGSRETALLSPELKIQKIHALLLTGGSAFGLSAADGVVRYLEERGIGYQTPFAKVPIVPAAVIYDLNLGNPSARPSADDAYRACQSAKLKLEDQGSVGAGTGATVGKWTGIEYAMKGGFGCATEHNQNIWVRGIVVTNPVGDVVEMNGKILAGALDGHRRFRADSALAKRLNGSQLRFGQNTVLGVILTNVLLTKSEAFTVCKRAANGLARCIVPVGTSYDGDIIFTLSTGEIKSDIDLVSELAAETLRRAVISSVQHATSIGGCLSINDLS